MVSATVATEGKLDQMLIVESPDDALTEAIAEALNKWTFRPASAGRPSSGGQDYAGHSVVSVDSPCLAGPFALPWGRYFETIHFPAPASHFHVYAPEMTVASILQAKTTFVVLQVLDFFTTMVAFHFGAFEVNPLVARLNVFFGPVGGVLASKVIAVLIALGVRRRLWIVNMFYVGVVCWNVVILSLLSFVRH